MMANFEAGKTYSTRSACDHNCIYTMKVLARTPKTIRVQTMKGEHSLRIFSNYRGDEAVKPFGSYSMAPIISAEDLGIKKADWER